MFLRRAIDVGRAAQVLKLREYELLRTNFISLSFVLRSEFPRCFGCYHILGRLSAPIPC
jgi:hypothetical protein